MSYTSDRLPMEQLAHRVIMTLLITTLVVYQGNVASYFIPKIDAWSYWRPVYYGLWLLILSSVTWALAMQPRILGNEWPVVLLSIFSASLVVLHPIAPVAKSYLVSIGLYLCVTLLLAYCRSPLIVRISAIVSAGGAIFCFVDIINPHGFTNTVGRAAGLAEGPNLAAAQLVLGAAI